MITDQLAACSRYAALDDRFELAFTFLRRLVGGEVAASDAVIEPGQVWATVVTKPGRAALDAGFEYHEHCADVHLCLAGEEHIGWAPTTAGLARRQAFDADRDFGLYAGTPEFLLPLADRRFAIFFPGELHAPLIGGHELTKVCVKVRLSSSS